MRLVQHDHGVSANVGVDETLALQHAIRHVLDPGLWAGAILETDGVTDFLPKATSNFFSHTFGNRHRSYTSRLCAAYLASVGEAILSKVLSHLGCLSRASITDNNQDLMLFIYKSAVTGCKQEHTHLSDSLQQRVP